MENPRHIDGIVLKFIQDKGFGFIKGADGIERFFHVSNVRNKIIFKPGTKVRFQPVKKNKGELATDIFELRETSTKRDNTQLFKSIRDTWMLEAKNEDNIKLFYNVDELEQILSGNKCYVIGRKGTGKTALSEHLFNLKDHATYTERMSFKSFPFNELYDLKDGSFSFTNQYITIWKYIIYGSTLKMMSLNERIDPRLIKVLRNMFPIDPIDTLERKFKRLTQLEISIELFGGMFKTSSNNGLNVDKELTIGEKANLFEELVMNYIDNSKYILIFDALDDDYNNIEMRQLYAALLAGLFKAVQEIKSVFPPTKFKLLPIIFLRDDIYSKILDSDKSKWRDFSVPLIWNKTKIQNMLAHRISKTINNGSKALSFEDAWHKLFSFDYIEAKFGSKKNAFDFLCEQTYMRPRDFVQYFKVCCDKALIQDMKEIDEQLVINAMKSLSFYMRSDLQGEISTELPYIQEVLNVISHLRKQEFKYTEFAEKYIEFVSALKISGDKSPEQVLEILFKFNVIGNKTKGGNTIFQMWNSHATLNLKENIYLHKGLLNSLNA